MKFLTLLLVLSYNAFGGESTYACKYDRTKVETISVPDFIESSVTIYKSIGSLKYLLYINDIKNMNKFDDYIVIENSKKQRITHYLECSK